MNGANLVGGPLSIAIEFVLQLVDFNEPTVRLVGWALAGILAGLALLLFLRRRRSSSSPPAVLDLALELGKEMLKFVRMRESLAPPPSHPTWPGLSFLPGWEKRSNGGPERESHDTETMSIWTGRFAKRLNSTLAKLHNTDRIDHAEVKRLLLPATPTEVRSVALRLIDLGCQDA